MALVAILDKGSYYRYMVSHCYYKALHLGYALYIPQRFDVNHFLHGLGRQD
jgi:hypothetical protein